MLITEMSACKADLRVSPSNSALQESGIPVFETQETLDISVLSSILALVAWLISISTMLAASARPQ